MSTASSTVVGPRAEVHNNYFVIAIDPRGSNHTKLSGNLTRTAADQQAKSMQVNDRSRCYGVGEYAGANFSRLRNVHVPK